MKKSMILGLALAALTSVGGATLASARPAKVQDFVGTWRLDDRHSNGRGDWNDRNGRSGNDDRYGDNDRDGRYGDRDGRYGDRDGRNDSRQAFGAGSLPQVIRIERERRELHVENLNGRTLREIEIGRGNRNANQLQAHTRNLTGMQVTEFYSLRDGGRELVVRTVVRGPRGSREFTSVYDRA